MCFILEYDFHALRVGADIGLLLTEPGDSCGIAWFNSIGLDQTLGVVARDCAVGYYSFGHEIAHMLGAEHNREAKAVNNAYPNAHGFLMNPPVNSGYRTIMA